jgi:hypothetical protein
MNAARGVLIAVGAALAAFGAVELVTTLSIADLAWLAVWLAGAIVLHDVVLVPSVALLRGAFRRHARRWPRAVGVVAEIAFGAAAVVTLFVVPELWAQSRGTPNPTLLTGDYATRLLLMWVIALLAVLIPARVLIRRGRRDAAVRRRGTR